MLEVRVFLLRQEPIQCKFPSPDASALQAANAASLHLKPSGAQECPRSLYGACRSKGEDLQRAMVDGDFEGLQRICLSSCMITDHMANRCASCALLQLS